jgi:hypothetical protein
MESINREIPSYYVLDTKMKQLVTYKNHNNHRLPRGVPIKWIRSGMSKSQGLFANRFPLPQPVYARSQAIERVSRGTSEDITEISLVDRSHPCLGLVPL